MNSPRYAPARGRFPLIGVMLLVAACGSGSLSGSYTPAGGAGFFEKLNFTSGKTVEITFMGQTRALDYQLDGKKLKVVTTNAGETQVFTVDASGCLDGGGILGKYCHAGVSPVAGSGTPLSGTWEAKAPGGSFQLRFTGRNTVQLITLEDGRSPATEEATYETSGDRVTIKTPDGPAVDLTRSGRSLQGALGGITITFTLR